MGKTFSTMKTDIGNRIFDTSTGTASIIGKMINDKYHDIYNRAFWSALIDDNYTFESVVDQAGYDLPTDFGDEIMIVDIATGKRLEKMTEEQWWRDRYHAYQDDSITSGTPARYVILEEVINASGVRTGQIKLDPPPSVVETYGMPYKRKFTELLGTTGTCTTDTASKIINSSATFITDGVQAGMLVKNTTDGTYGYVSTVDSETQLTMESDLCPDGDENYTVSNEMVIPNIEWIIELGCIGEGLAYKQQFQKADYFLQRFEIEVQKRVGQEKARINKKYQRVGTRTTTGIRYLLGERSYDSL